VALTHLFFDIGGVLGTNGWDHEQREQAFARFGIDKASFEDRHKEIVASLEEGRISLDEYLATTVFHQPRRFTPDELKAFIFSLSAPYTDSIALARALAGTGKWRMATLNNESEELNRHRLRLFGLRDIFGVCYSSCWLGVLKPARRIYELALAMSQAEAGSSVFVDDRERNLAPAAALGMTTILYTGAAQLRADLAAHGVAP
jgi:putative hydrolase of the HAD superfamily